MPPLCVTVGIFVETFVVRKLSNSVICMILRLAVLVELPLVTADRQMDAP